MTTTAATSKEHEPHFGQYPLRYTDRNGLAALPWFDIDHGEIVIADKTIGPIIDVHTHYAMPSLRQTADEVRASIPEKSDLLLGACCAHHLDIYANQCFTPAELNAMIRELTVGALRKKGKRATMTAPNMARDMKSMGIERTIVLGLDMGLFSRHVGLTLDVAKTRTDGIPFGSIHPRVPMRRIRFEEQLHRGARGIKIHPPNMFTRPDHPRLMDIYRWCGEEQIPVFWHCGPAGIESDLAAACAQVRYYERPIRENPDTIFVLGHSGATQSEQALQLFNKYKNTYLDISCISLFQLQDVLNQGDEDRIMFGSDWPFYHPVLPLAKVLMLTEDRPKLRRKVLYENAARLLEKH